MDKEQLSVDEQITQHSISEILEKLCALNSDNPVDWRENLNDLLLKNINTSDSHIEIENKSQLIKELHNLNSEDKSLEWKYICLNFYYFVLLREIFERNPQKENFSVQQTIKLENILRNVIAIGISSNLHPKLPYYSQLPSKVNNFESVSVLITYKRLLGTTYGFYTILTSFPHIKSIIVSNFLRWILCSFYQIIHCPLMKPCNTVDATGFMMTESIYKSLLSDRQLFQKYLIKLATRIHPILYVRETMLLRAKTAPTWLIGAVSFNLNQFIARKNGVENLAWAMLDASEADERDDIAKSWNALHVLSKIIIATIKLPNFRENICGQLNSLLNLRDSSGKSIKAFERLYTLCIKLLYQDDAILCQNVFVDSLLDSLLCYTKPKIDVSENETITESISQTMRILRFLVIEDCFNTFLIPIHTVFKTGNVLFHILAVTLENQNMKELSDNIRDCLLKILQECESKFELFDNLLFDFSCENYLKLQPNINFCTNDNNLYPKQDECGIKLVLFDRAEVLQKIITSNSSIKASLFTYLLNCLVNHEKYFKRSNTELLDLEPDFILDEVSERKIVVFRLLSELSEDKTIQKHIVQNPSSFVSYLDDVLKTNIKNEVHKMIDSESEDFQMLFLMVMILQALINDTPKSNLHYYSQVKESLTRILRECENGELKTLIKNALSMFTGEKTREHTHNDNDNNSTSKTELDKAIEDVCDPLLPVRGHGLMTLTKLIREKDKNALERKRYICNIFQNTLKDADSFIYLSAIGGLATMGDIFPDTILNVLSEEYTDFSRHTFENNQEIRLKLGEVLVRITRLLGEMAPKYKALLLNTFLYGIKDDDYLIRASSLSNLGEICRVLGYKLGTTISEVLVAVHAIITTDKAPEARRAAVTVLRQLFVGLEKEMIVFLKDDILPVYRTLKMIYTNDPDDVMRLQAQLALEQLNENMKDFVLPLMGLNAVNTNRFVLPEKEINIKLK